MGGILRHELLLGGARMVHVSPSQGCRNPSARRGQRLMAEPGLTTSQRPPSGWAIRQKLQRLRQCDPGCGGGEEQQPMTKSMSRTPPKLLRSPAKTTSLLAGDELAGRLGGEPSHGDGVRNELRGGTRCCATSNTAFVRDFYEFLDARHCMSNKITQHGADRNVKGSPHQTSSSQQLLAVSLSAACLLLASCVHQKVRGSS